MSDTERIIEAVSIDAWESVEVGAISPIIPPLVNLAMSGVCPECGGEVRRLWSNLSQSWHDPSGAITDREFKPRCPHHYHDHREELDARLAERGGDSR